MNALAIAIRYAPYVLKIVDTVKAIVLLVEAIHAGAVGPDKKAAALDALRTDWDIIRGETGMTVSFDTLAPVLGLLIDLSVAFFNVKEIFSHRNDPPTAAAISFAESNKLTEGESAQ